MKTLTPKTLVSLSDAPADISKVIWRKHVWHRAKTSQTKVSTFSFKDKNVKLNYRVLYDQDQLALAKNEENKQKTNDTHSAAETIKSNQKEKTQSGENRESHGTSNPARNVPSELKYIEVVKDKNRVAGKRGRPRLNQAVIEFPKGNFTVKELADKLNVKPYIISNEIARQTKLKIAKFEVVKQIPQPSGRGRPTNVFKIVTEVQTKVVKAQSPKTKKLIKKAVKVVKKLSKPAVKSSKQVIKIIKSKNKKKKNKQSNKIKTKQAKR